MYKFASIALLIFVISGCTKDVTETQLPTDSIVHTELQPFLEVTSVDTVLSHPSGCGSYPLPADSAASLALDINDDGQSDFTLSCTSWYQFVSASGPCANYNTSIVLTGTSADNQIALSQDYNIVKLFAFGDIISGLGEWANSSTLMLSAATTPFDTDFNGDHYIGLKMTQGQNVYYGWLSINKTDYLMTVKSYALNLTSGNDITAGQIQ